MQRIAVILLLMGVGMASSYGAILLPPYTVEEVGAIAASRYWVVDQYRVLTLAPAEGAAEQRAAHFFLRVLPTLKVVREWNIPGQFLDAVSIPGKQAWFFVLLYDSTAQQLVCREVSIEGQMGRQYVLAEQVGQGLNGRVLLQCTSSRLYAVVGRYLYVYNRRQETVQRSLLTDGEVVAMAVHQDTVWVLHAMPTLSYVALWVRGALVGRAQLAVGKPRGLYRVNNLLVVLHQFPHYVEVSILRAATLQALATTILPFRRCHYAVLPADTTLHIVAVGSAGESLEIQIGHLKALQLRWQRYLLDEIETALQLVLAAGPQWVLLSTATRVWGINLAGEVLFEEPLALVGAKCGTFRASFRQPHYLLVHDAAKELRVWQVEQRLWWERIALEQYWEYAVGILGFGIVMLIVIRLLQYRRIIRTLFVLPTADVFFVFNRQLRLVRYNHIGRRFLENDPEAIGKPVGLLQQQLPALQTVFEEVKKVQQQQVRSSAMLQMQDPATRQRREWIFHITPIRGLFGRPRGILAVGRDVTEVMQHQRLINWAQLVHDMQTNLSIIRLNAELLAKQQGAEQRSLVQKIMTQALILQGRVKDVLELARQSEREKDRQLEEFDVAELCRQVKEELEGILPRGAEIVLKLRPCRMAGYPKLLERGIRNAVWNAIKALKNRPGTIWIRCREGAEYVEILVQDTGVGMSEETLQQVFRPGVSGFEHGTGLGTMIIVRAVEAHHGWLIVKSKLGEGTRVYFYLPKKPELSQLLHIDAKIQSDGAQEATIIAVGQTSFVGR